jgi:hypothetical protein
MGMKSFEGLNTESVEVPKHQYVYVNTELPGRPVVFRCNADSQERADELFEAQMGKRPDKENHIGCSVVEN